MKGKTMMTGIQKLFWSALFAAGLGGFLTAQTTAFEVLGMGSGAESVALGGAVSAEMGSVEGALYNPAALGSLQEDWKIIGAFNPWLSATLAHAVVAKKFGSVAFAVSGIGLFYEAIQGYVAYSGDSGQSLAAGDFVFGATGAWSPSILFKLPVVLDFGFSIRYAHQVLDTEVMSVLVGDAGAVMGFKNIFGEDVLSLGIYGKNFGVPLSAPAGIPLPFTLSAGASYRLQPKKFFLAFKFLADGSFDFKDSLKLNLGTALEFFKLFSLRAGYTFGSEVRGLSVGAGARLPLRGASLVLDYALIPLGTMGIQQSLQLGAEFAVPVPKVPI